MIGPRDYVPRTTTVPPDVAGNSLCGDRPERRNRATIVRIAPLDTNGAHQSY